MPKSYNRVLPDCMICLQRMRHGTILSCSHKFHKGCINTWFKKKDTCPICRDTADRKNPNRINESDFGNLSPREIEDQKNMYRQLQEEKTTSNISYRLSVVLHRRNHTNQWEETRRVRTYFKWHLINALWMHMKVELIILMMLIILPQTTVTYMLYKNWILFSFLKQWHIALYVLVE